MLKRLAGLSLYLLGSVLLLTSTPATASADEPVCHKTDPRTGTCVIWVNPPGSGVGGRFRGRRCGG